ncbi:hypothetical protein PENSPDRAFT_294343 [Peniophora sp. CONT]|nr:hypothetical protein PENSPDRAFT_294343 [Peniophora sp. CONT]
MAIKDWNDPNLVEKQYLDDVNLQHAIFGLYIWELLQGSQFDYDLLRRSRRNSSSTYAKWVYLGCRWFPLASLMTITIGYNVSSPINCRAWLVFAFLWSFAAIGLASTLMAIRAVAVCGNSRPMIGLCVVLLALQLALFINELIEADANWVPAIHACSPVDTQSSRANVTATFISDLILLVAIIVRLYRWKEARASRSGVWEVLWHQGLIWLALAVLAEAPTVVLLWLNLNPVMNEVFFAPEMIVLVIGATRMYRMLSLHFTNTHDPSIVYGSTLRVRPPGVDTIPMRNMSEQTSSEPTFRRTMSFDASKQEVDDDERTQV